MFFDEMDLCIQKDIVDFLEDNKFLIVSDILKGRDKLPASWMLIYVKPKNIWTLLAMSVVINFYGNGRVRITDKGSIKIGRITMQRKGGDNGRSTANMLQFKMNPAEIINEDNSNDG